MNEKKISVRRMHIKRIALCLCLLMLNAHAQEQRKRRLDFEQLFPPTTYKNALETTMQVWSDLVEWRETGIAVGNPDDTTDLIVGRLIRLQHYIEKLAKDHTTRRRIYSQDDLCYLNSVLDLASAELQSLTQTDGSLNIALLEDYFEAVKTLFERF